tara:strand:+ start:55 stop:543 length:489 start_codon:yes stop_codon:yes gene_type:complete
MAIPGHEFITAHFTNDERTIVDSYWSDGEATRVEHIEAKEDNHSWKDLLTRIDIDQLHELTYKHIKRQERAFANKVIAIGKEEGIINDANSSISSEFLVKTLFSKDKNESESKNDLFVLKLKLFELEFVKNCKVRKLKSALRKAENSREVIKIAIEIFEQSN